MTLRILKKWAVLYVSNLPLDRKPKVTSTWWLWRSLWRYITGQRPNFGPYCKHLSHFVPQPQNKNLWAENWSSHHQPQVHCAEVSQSSKCVRGLDRGLQYLLCGECDQMRCFSDHTATCQFRVRPRSRRYSSQWRIMCWHWYPRREYWIIGAWCPSPHWLLWGTWFEQFMLVTILVPATQHNSCDWFWNKAETPRLTAYRIRIPEAAIQIPMVIKVNNEIMSV